MQDGEVFAVGNCSRTFVRTSAVGIPADRSPLANSPMPWFGPRLPTVLYLLVPSAVPVGAVPASALATALAICCSIEGPPATFWKLRGGVAAGVAGLVDGVSIFLFSRSVIAARAAARFLNSVWGPTPLL